MRVGFFVLYYKVELVSLNLCVLFIVCLAFLTHYNYAVVIMYFCLNGFEFSKEFLNILKKEVFSRI